MKKQLKKQWGRGSRFSMPMMMTFACLVGVTHIKHAKTKTAQVLGDSISLIGVLSLVNGLYVFYHVFDILDVHLLPPSISYGQMLLAL